MTKELFAQIVLMVVISFTFVALIIPFIKKIAIQVGAVDIPRGRHIHKEATPKLGGVAIFLGFLLGYMLFGTASSQMNSILIGSFIILITGIVDDIVELKPSVKFSGQIAASLVIAAYGGILLKDVSAFGIYLDFGILCYPLTVFFILGCINCMNLIDGLDGLSGGISSIYFLTIGIIATMQGKHGLDFVLTFVMLGSTLGFLLHNFNPAKIFAGDSGSNFPVYGHPRTQADLRRRSASVEYGIHSPSAGGGAGGSGGCSFPRHPSGQSGVERSQTSHRLLPLPRTYGGG